MFDMAKKLGNNNFMSIKFNCELLKNLIKKNGLTNEAFAKELCSLGCNASRQSVQYWVIGGMPRAEAVLVMSRYFDVGMENFFIKSMPKKMRKVDYVK